MEKKVNKTQFEILEIGQKLIANKGFSSVGLSEILQSADVPKGSFYHYFSSKEKFGEEVILNYFENYHIRVDELFNSKKGTGLERVLNYFQLWLETQTSGTLDQKCLVVKLSAEVSDLSDKMRTALLEGSSVVVEKIAQVIKDGVKDKSISKVDADHTAKLLYHMWLGASLIAKLKQNSEELELCMMQTQAILTTKKVI